MIRQTARRKAGRGDRKAAGRQTRLCFPAELCIHQLHLPCPARPSPRPCPALPRLALLTPARLLPQVVKAQLAVRHIRDIRGVGSAPGLRGHVSLDQAHLQRTTARPAAVTASSWWIDNIRWLYQHVEIQQQIASSTPAASMLHRAAAAATTDAGAAGNVAPAPALATAAPTQLVSRCLVKKAVNHKASTCSALALCPGVCCMHHPASFCPLHSLQPPATCLPLPPAHHCPLHSLQPPATCPPLPSALPPAQPPASCHLPTPATCPPLPSAQPPAQPQAPCHLPTPAPCWLSGTSGPPASPGSEAPGPPTRCHAWQGSHSQSQRALPCLQKS